jgi:hypothetical protein
MCAGCVNRGLCITFIKALSLSIPMIAASQYKARNHLVHISHPSNTDKNYPDPCLLSKELEVDDCVNITTSSMMLVPE